jgi:hypothetical protein
MKFAVAAWAGGLARWKPPGAAAARADLDAFMTVSRRLTGKDDLDPGVGARLYAAFVRTDPAAAASITSLATILGTGADPVGRRLAHAPRPQRDAAQRILRGWYLGLVGDGPAASCVAYETILGYRPVADMVVMQSFCRGRAGYWAGAPGPRGAHAG